MALPSMRLRAERVWSSRQGRCSVAARKQQNRIGGRLYDLSLLAISAWFLLSGGSWLAVVVFAFANLMAFAIFDNRLVERPRALFRPWDGPVVVVLQCAIFVLPMIGELSLTERTAAVVAVVFMIATRALMRPLSKQQGT